MMANKIDLQYQDLKKNVSMLFFIYVGVTLAQGHVEKKIK